MNKCCINLSADQIATINHLISQGMGERLITKKHPEISVGYIRMHVKHCKEEKSFTGNTVVAEMQSTIDNFGNIYQEKAKKTESAAWFKNAGVNVPPTGFKGATIQQKIPVVVKDPETQIEETVFVNAWVRVASTEEEGLSDVAFDDFRQDILKGKAETPEVKEGGLTYFVNPSDLQGGKTRTSEAVENWKRGVKGHKKEIDKNLAAGVNISEVVLNLGGDIIESYANNYTNQTHIIELNLTQQLNLAVDVILWSIKTLYSKNYKLTVVAYPSNHGEWTRNGNKEPITNYTDNADIFCAQQVQKMFRMTKKYKNVAFNIASDKHYVLASFSGVKVYMSHGYQEKGSGAGHEKNKNAIQKQILGNLDAMYDLKLAITAHYHHAYDMEFEGKTLMGLPACEAEKSSEYMLNRFGVWSRPGVKGFLVGESLGPRGWSNLNIF